MFEKFKVKKIKKQLLKDIVYGVAVGDALGVPYEFRTRAYMQENPCTTMVGQQTHDQPKGTWSDDTSLMLCLLDGMNFSNHTIDINKVAHTANGCRKPTTLVVGGMHFNETAKEPFIC